MGVPVSAGFDYWAGGRPLATLSKPVGGFDYWLGGRPLPQLSAELRATVAATETADSAAITGGTGPARVGRVTWAALQLDPAREASIAGVETRDSAVLSGGFTRQGRVTWVEIDLAQSVAGIVATEARDSAVLTATVTTAGRIVAVETKDAAALAGGLVRQGRLTWLNFEATANTPAQAAIAGTESSDSAILAGHPIITAQIAGTETTDAAGLAGDATGLTNAQIFATDSPDTSVDAIGIAGTESGDRAAITGKPTVGAGIVATDSPDLAAITGMGNVPVVDADIGAVEITDDASISAAPWMTAQIVATDESDAAAIDGKLVLPAGIAATEEADSASLTGDENAPQPVVKPDVGAGKGKPTRPRRHRWYVEIDGEEFEVRDEAEALRLLAQAREAAQETARRAAEASIDRSAEDAPQAAPIVPQISVSPALEALIGAPLAEVRGALEEIYRVAFYRAAHHEILRRAALRVQQAQMAKDEEDALSALLQHEEMVWQQALKSVSEVLSAELRRGTRQSVP